MLTPRQYWIGVGLLAALVLVLPVLLILEDNLLGAAFAGLPAALVLIAAIALTADMFSKSG